MGDSDSRDPPRHGDRLKHQRGSAIVEFAIVLPLLALVVMGTIDLGRAFRLQNRLTNSAREGGALAQFRPANVDAGCDQGLNIVDRAAAEDPGLGSASGFRVQVFKRDPSGSLLPAQGYSGCRTVSSVTLAAGDRVVVRVGASFSPITPLVSAFVGTLITVTGSQEVVVQG